MFYAKEDIIKLSNQIDDIILEFITLKLNKVNMEDDKYIISLKKTTKSIQRIINKFEDIYECSKNGESDLIYYLDEIFCDYNYLVGIFNGDVTITHSDEEFWRKKHIKKL